MRQAAEAAADLAVAITAAVEAAAAVEAGGGGGGGGGGGSSGGGGGSIGFELLALLGLIGVARRRKSQIRRLETWPACSEPLK